MATFPTAIVPEIPAISNRVFDSNIRQVNGFPSHMGFFSARSRFGYPGVAAANLAGWIQFLRLQSMSVLCYC